MEMCPRCGRETDIQRLPLRQALSRKDNETYICSSCGTDEAMLDLSARAQGIEPDVWPGYPGVMAVYAEGVEQ